MFLNNPIRIYVSEDGAKLPIGGAEPVKATAALTPVEEVEKPVVTEPAEPEIKAEESVAAESAASEVKVEEPVAEPVASEVKTEEPVAAEPVASEVKAEEPAAEPVVSDVKTEDLSTAKYTEAELMAEEQATKDVESEAKAIQPAVTESDKSEDEVVQTVSDEEVCPVCEEKHPSVEVEDNKYTLAFTAGDIVLDMGCDSSTIDILKAKGCKVIDGSSTVKMCKMAGEFGRISLSNLIFRELRETAQYAGIIARDSINHLNDSQLTDMFTLMADNLRPNGVVYASFGLGDFAGKRDGVYCTDLTEEKLNSLVTASGALTVVKTAVNSDNNELNVILRK